MHKLFAFLLPFLLLAGCQTEEEVASPEVLLKVEKEFSDMSATKGVVKAFLHYCDDEGVLLRANTYPVYGKAAISKRLSGMPDSTFTLTWEPLEARISSSGDLGYTYGIYQIRYKDETLPDEKGSYVTIWKKDSEGQWKFMMDTGQEGIGD